MTTHSERDIPTEVADVLGLSPAEIETIEASDLRRMIARIMAGESDPTDPLYGGDPPPIMETPDRPR